MRTIKKISILVVIIFGTQIPAQSQSINHIGEPDHDFDEFVEIIEADIFQFANKICDSTYNEKKQLRKDFKKFRKKLRSDINEFKEVVKNSGQELDRETKDEIKSLKNLMVSISEKLNGWTEKREAQKGVHQNAAQDGVESVVTEVNLAGN